MDQLENYFARAMRSIFGFDVPDLTHEVDRAESGTRYACVDCTALSPAVASNFTLISSRFGWRLHRYLDAQTHRTRMEWRCPHCWRVFREARRRRAISSLPPLAPGLNRSR